MTTPAGRLVRVEPIMGTVVGVDIRDQVGRHAFERAVDRFFETLRAIDRRFSPWRDDSEITAISEGRLAEPDASADMRWVLAVCDHLAATSRGAFDARRHRADGRVDPSGFVKGWAIEEAACVLDDAGFRNYAINAGGDVVVRGRPRPETASSDAWRVGIRHPEQADRVATVLPVVDMAVATSGCYERGEHIVDPRTAAAPAELLSLTVVGPSLAWADAYATAAFVMGVDGLRWVADHPGYAALAITADRRVVRFSVLEALLTPPVGPETGDPESARSAA